MNVLVAANPESPNPLVRQLVGCLRAHPEIRRVEAGREAFLAPRAGFDVVHLHWPEVLHSWLRRAPDPTQRIVELLERWHGVSTLVATVHNRHPHAGDSPRSRRLYDRVYERCAAFLHLGWASVDEHARRRPHLAARPAAVAPIGIPDFPNRVSREEARRVLGIPQTAPVWSAFGSLRPPYDAPLLLEGFRRALVPGAWLVVAGERLALGSSRWRERVTRARIRCHPRILLHIGRVADDAVQLYLNAADVVVLPRARALNSGGIALAFGFGRVVVGPDDGNVGAILRETGNPVFRATRRDGLAEAMVRGLRLARAGHGDANLLHAADHGSWRRVAERHVSLYRRALTAGRPGPARLITSPPPTSPRRPDPAYAPGPACSRGSPPSRSPAPAPLRSPPRCAAPRRGRTPRRSDA